MSVREAQERISSSEFAEWIAYYSIQPFGERRADEHNAWLCYWVHTSMCGGNMQPKDFMISDESDKSSTVDDKMGLLEAVALSCER